MTLVVGFLSAMCFVVWAGALYFLPWCARSAFRYRMWELRDDAIDDVLAGRIVPTPAVLAFIRDLENGIRVARHVSILSVLLVPTEARTATGRSRSAARADIQKLPADQQVLFAGYQRRMRSIVGRHLLLGSLLGWTLLAALGAFFFVKGLYRGLTVRDGDPSGPVTYARTQVGERGRAQAEPDRVLAVADEISSRPRGRRPISAYAG